MDIVSSIISSIISSTLSRRNNNKSRVQLVHCQVPWVLVGTTLTVFYRKLNIPRACMWRTTEVRPAVACLMLCVVVVVLVACMRAFGCTRLHSAALGCTRLHSAALFLVVAGGGR